MRRWSRDGAACSFIKDELYDPVTDTGMIADIDAWVDSRAGLTAPNNNGFNGAISASYRSKASADQKTDLLIAVAAMRRGINYLRSIFGETE